MYRRKHRGNGTYGKVYEVGGIPTCGFPSSVFASVFIFLCSRFKFVKDSLWSWVFYGPGF